MNLSRYFFVAALLAILSGFSPTQAAKYYDIETWEPPIHKPLLHFTEYKVRPATECIVIHNTGFPGGDKDSTAADVHKFHQETNGWAGIGYHFLIRKDGTIEQGRKLDAVGAHSYHHNMNSIGICLAGNFNIGKPTEKQMESVKMLTAWICKKYNLNPMKKGVVVGHRNFNDTDCPGEKLYSKLDLIRRGCADYR